MDYQTVIEIISVTALVLNIAGIVKIYVEIANRLIRIEERFNSHIEVSDRDVTEVFRRLNVLEGRPND